VDVIVKTYFPYVLFFGTAAGLLVLLVILSIMLEQRKKEREFLISFANFAVSVESLIMKFTPLLDAQMGALEKTKECPQCKKRIDEAYGACPFCSHEFAKKYFVSVIAPGDEKALDVAAKKLSAALKIEFPQMKYRLRVGFDYAIADHTKRHEFMTAVEKMGCTVKEIVRWV
jgi:RNA polymerase subunit RPABC4/transcription elongation factor Spt4